MPNHPQSFYKTYLTASGLVKTGAGVISKIISGDAGSIVVYDNTAASGDIIYSGSVVAGTPLLLEVEFVKGCYVAMTTTTHLTAVYA